jgi:hypothetical protein
MTFPILIPHFKNGKITAYAISQLIKHKGKYNIEIYVVNNNSGDGSERYLKPFTKYIKYQEYPKSRLSSHGIAFDYILPYVNHPFFITIESDSFPTSDDWLDYYEELINKGYDAAGSFLKLSGGTYMHPCGAMYSKNVWREAKEICKNTDYTYFPNMCRKDGLFDYHLMLHRDVVEKVLSKPNDYVNLSDGYKKLDRKGYMGKMLFYSPTVQPFHNGMGMIDESVKTYGSRNIETEVPNILLNGKKKIVCRVGYEPGQWLTYFMLATGKKVYDIPTKIKWLEGRENQQQEFTKMVNGFTHIWAGSSFLDMQGTEYDDVYQFKKNQIDELYNSLPSKYKI